MKKFCDLIPFWKKEGREEMVSNFLKKRADLLVEKKVNLKDKQRAKSGQPNLRKSADLKLTRESSALKQKKEISFKKNNSQQFLRKYR